MLEQPGCPRSATTYDAPDCKVSRQCYSIKPSGKRFANYSGQFAVIGGTASDLLMNEEYEDLRTTRDFRYVLIAESFTPTFWLLFWEYVKAANYKRWRNRNAQPQYYRFSQPRSRE